MEIREITAKLDKDLAELIRDSLAKHELDIPGTVFFDDSLDHLSEFYLEQIAKRKYFVLMDNDVFCGGAGFAEFDPIEDCAELQKLYLKEEYQGKGLGKMLLNKVENEARKMGYKKLYIETHTNLDTALNMYRKYGYRIIQKPEAVNHGSMNRFLIKDL